MNTATANYGIIAESTYVQLIAEPGRLRMKLTAEGVEELRDNLEGHPEWDDDAQVWELLCEAGGTGALLGNWEGTFTPDCSQWGNLSEAPMFASHTDNSELSEEMQGPQPAADATLWYFEPYMVRSMVADLKECGEVLFTELQ